jgi:hypothetical protein
MDTSTFLVTLLSILRQKHNLIQGVQIRKRQDIHTDPNIVIGESNPGRMRWPGEHHSEQTQTSTTSLEEGAKHMQTHVIQYLSYKTDFF